MKIISLFTLGLVCLVYANSTVQAAQPEFERIEKSTFGVLSDGTTVQAFTLRNRHGIEVGLMEYGATITRILTPDQFGDLKNIIAGSALLEDYVKGFPAASVIGRFANRIAGASFHLDGHEHHVTANAGQNHIHGGRKGFAKVVWKGEVIENGPESTAVRFTYLSKDGEEGFPGRLEVGITYTLNDDNELRLSYDAVTDKPTPVNLTNHAYFNLANTGGYAGHVLRLDAGLYTPSDGQLIPTGEIKTVSDSPLDFRMPQKIGGRTGDVQPRPGVYDHNFVLDKYDGELAWFAQVLEPESGRVMEVATTEPGVQLYTGNPIGFCLETQHFPASPNHPHFPSTIVRPGRPFKSMTLFRFSIIESSPGK